MRAFGSIGKGCVTVKAFRIAVLTLLSAIVILQLRIIDVTTKTRFDAAVGVDLANRSGGTLNMTARRIAANLHTPCETARAQGLTPTLECDGELGMDAPHAIAPPPGFLRRLYTDEPEPGLPDDTYDANYDR